MKIVDLTHLMNVHTPGWVGYAGNKMYYAQNLQTKRIVAQRIDIALHVGTHIDGAMHGTDGMGDMASYSLDFLVGPGAVVDVSQHMDDWAVITPAMIESAPVEVKDGDILIIHTGWHRYWEGQPQQDLVRYFCMHPGGNIELLEWMLKKKIKWFGIDCGSGDHSMNTSIRICGPISPSGSRKKSARAARNSSANSATRTRNRAVTSPKTCFRSTATPSRRA